MTPIDTLYYQWATDDEDKQAPSIFEDIQTIDEAEKIHDLLGVHAELVAQLIEAEVDHRAILDDYIARAQDDPALAECSDTEVAEAISEVEEITESEGYVEAASSQLDMFHDNFVAVMAGVE
ncbi:MAG: hypothetical protein JRC86_07570 [Deltaproteobacteria bacterium]|nr:hypothetical protein [Deltaproteobacteria bacterium]